MALLKVARLRKHRLIFGILLVLVCLLAGTRASAQADALVDAKSSAGSTALFAASYYGHLDVVQALLAKGEDVNARSNGTTALYVASQEGQLDVVQALLANGADVGAKLSD